MVVFVRVCASEPMPFPRFEGPSPSTSVCDRVRLFRDNQGTFGGVCLILRQARASNRLRLPRGFAGIHAA